MKTCYSYSLYGDRSMYSNGLVHNIRLLQKLTPEDDIVVHAESGHYAIPLLRRLGVRVIEAGENNASSGMFWRYRPIVSGEYDIVSMRDADALIDEPEIHARKEWIESGEVLHRLFGEHHKMYTPIMGGAWDVRPEPFLKLLPEFPELIDVGDRRIPYGFDEALLKEKVWPRIKAHTKTSLLPCVPGVPSPLDKFTPDFVEPIDRVVVLSAPHYVKRRELFFENWAHGGPPALPVPEVFVGRTEETHGPVPEEFWAGIKRAPLPHYYYATQDHYTILRAFLASDAHTCAVFEDDTRFDNEGWQTGEYIRRALVAVPEDWSAIALGAAKNERERREHIAPPRVNALWRVTGAHSTTAVIWSRAGAERFLAFAEDHPNKIVDQAFLEFQKEDRRVFAPVYWLVHSDARAVQYGKDS